MTTTMVLEVQDRIEARTSRAGKSWATFRGLLWTGRGEDRRSETHDCKVFGDLADHLAHSVAPGDTILAYGRYSEETWMNEEGQSRRKVAFIIDDAGPSLRSTTATVERVPRRPKPDQHYEEPF